MTSYNTGKLETAILGVCVFYSLLFVHEIVLATANFVFLIFVFSEECKDFPNYGNASI